jgi:hypothetical protein
MIRSPSGTVLLEADLNDLQSKLELQESSMEQLRMREKQVCITIIGVFSVVSMYSCVYYCDTCYISSMEQLRMREKQVCSMYHNNSHNYT